MSYTGYAVIVWDRDHAHFVGRRDSLAAAVDAVDTYNADPIAAGHFFAVHVRDNVVTWSDDWIAVTDMVVTGEAKSKSLGPATYGDVKITLPYHLLDLEAARERVL